MPLLEALPRLHSLKEFGLQWTLSHPDESLKMIGECVGRSTMEELTLGLFSSSLQSEEWVQSIVVGGNCLIRSLKSCQLTKLTIVVVLRNVLFPVDTNVVEAQLYSSLEKSVTFTNSERRRSSVFTNPLHFHVIC